METTAAAAGVRERYNTLAERLQEITHLEGISALLSWDMEVIMPHGSGDARGKQMSALAGVLHEKKTSAELGRLITALADQISASSELNDYERANVRDAKRDYDQEVLVPKELAQKVAELENRGHSVWAEARKQSDFASFAPVLREWVDLRKKICALVEPTKPAYDVCIDRFERGMTAQRFDEIFSEVKAGLVPLIADIARAQAEKPELNFDRSFLHSEAFSTVTQDQLGTRISKDLGFSTECGRLDVSTHPFTGGPHPTDVRITTRYSPNLLEGLMGTIHETGHALYEQGRNAEHIDLPVGRALGMGIHESQSLFYERMVGQSRHFWKYAWPVACEFFPQLAKEHSVEEMYRALNVVTPSLIRVDADEVTYSLHVILRFEIERDLFNGNLAIEDLPKVWNEKMKSYLGVVPPSDKEGVLQDVHWSAGLYGYFPSYSLGAMYACQFYNKAKEEIPELEEQLAQGQFEPIKAWLGKKIHQKGSLLPSGDELCQAVTGEPLNPAHFLRYLRSKYSEIYQLPSQ